jgi:hypothetical protein
MTEAYKIGINIAMSTNHVQVLQALTAGLLGVNTKVDQLTGSFSKLKLAIAGAFGVWAGDKMLSGIKDIVEATKDLSHELVQIQKLGMSAAQTGEINRRAIQVTRDVRGITQEQALEIYANAYSPFGKDAALQLMEPLAKFAVATGNTTGNFDVNGSDMMKMVRSADMLGQFTDPKTHQLDVDRFQHFLSLAAKVTAATHNMVSPNSWLQMAQQGGPSLMHLSDEGLITMGITSQYMGGGRAGTAMMSLYQQMAGGTMYTRNAEEMQRLGLITAGEWHKDGGHVVLTPGASRRLTSQIGDDPLSWVQNTVIPAMESRGIKDPEEQMNELFRLLTRQTTQRASADWIRNMQQMLSERERIKGGMDLDGSLGVANSQDVEQSLHNLSTAWQNLLYAIAGPNSEAEVAVINKMTDALRSLTEVFRSMNPDTLKHLAEGFALLGASLIAAGGVAIVAALGPAGWLVLGIGALATAIVAVPWKAAFDGLASGIKSLGDMIVSVWDKVKGLVGGDKPAPGQAPYVDPIPGPMLYHPGGAGGARLWPASYTSGITGPRISSAVASPMGDVPIRGGSSGRGSWFGFAPGWHDSEDNGRNASGLPQSVPGIALPSRSTLGQHFMVTAPNGKTLDLTQVDLGPAKWTGRGIDINATAAKAFGYTTGNFPTNGTFSWKPVGGVAQDIAAVPHGVLSGAAALLHAGGSSADLQRFMAAQGYPKSGAWCGEFTASVVHSAGGTPPHGAAVASNWLTWGQHVDPANVRPGDIAVRKFSRFGGMAHPGQTGSHVGIVSGVGNGGFDLLAGNQHAAIVHHGLGEYEFRRGPTGLAGMHGDALRDHFGHRGGRTGIPSTSSKSVTIHNYTTLDGKVVARNTAKHLSSDLNRVAKGSRVPDYTAIRPLEI